MMAGKLRHRVQIQSASKSTGTAGTELETWATVSTVYASITPLRAREMVDQAQLMGEVTHKIRLRYFAGLTGKHRIKYGARIFNIVGPPINVNERNREHELIAKEAI